MENIFPEVGLWPPIIIGIILAYLLGTPSSHVISRLKGIDILNFGSGNPGATNLSRAAGKPWGLLALSLDVSKGPLVIFLLVPIIVRIVGLSEEKSDIYMMSVVIALILGNIFPVFFGFKGGKGVATSLGIAFSLSWVSGLIGLGGFIFFLLLFDYVSLGSIMGTFVAVAYALADSREITIVAVYVTLLIIILIAHRKNIKCLLKGKERGFLKRKPVT